MSGAGGVDSREVSRALAERGGRQYAGPMLTEWPPHAEREARDRAVGIAFAVGFLVSSALWGLVAVLEPFAR